MKIAVCDDESKELERLGVLLSEYGADRRGLTVAYFSSGCGLAEAVSSGTRFDVIFLDILMPGESGMDTARQLRIYDKQAEIVFLTVSPDFALESYSVRARHYIVKPVIKDSLFSLLDEVNDHLERETIEMLTVDTKSGLRRLRTDQLEFCEVIGRTIYYHMSSGAVFQSSGTMGELEGQLLELPNFIKPHRSYIINMDFVAHIDSSTSVLTLESMKQIPIPRLRCGEVRECVAAYLTKKGGGNI